MTSKPRKAMDIDHLMLLKGQHKQYSEHLMVFNQILIQHAKEHPDRETQWRVFYMLEHSNKLKRQLTSCYPNFFQDFEYASVKISETHAILLDFYDTCCQRLNLPPFVPFFKV